MIDFEVKLTVSNACVIPPCAAALSSETDTNTAESEYKVDTLKVKAPSTRRQQRHHLRRTPQPPPPPPPPPTDGERASWITRYYKGVTRRHQWHE